MDAGKTKIDRDEAWKVLSKATSITTAKGKKVQTWNPGKDDRELILKQAMGPSGNLRAPALRVGDSIVIGFNADFYESWVR